MIRTLCVLYLHINCLWICILVEFVFVFVCEFVFVFAFVFVLIFVLFDFGRSFGHVITKWFPQCVIEGGPASNAPLRKTEWEIMNDNHQTIGSDKCSISLNWPKTPRVEAQIVTDGFSRELVMEEMLIMSRMEVYTNKPPAKSVFGSDFKSWFYQQSFSSCPWLCWDWGSFYFYEVGPTVCVGCGWVGYICHLLCSISGYPLLYVVTFVLLFDFNAIPFSARRKAWAMNWQKCWHWSLRQISSLFLEKAKYWNELLASGNPPNSQIWTLGFINR